MNKLTDLKFLFRTVAVVEVSYVLITLLPPSMLISVTGWTLNPDGHWLTKLLCAALVSQAWVAWVLRDTPLVSVAKALAFYQFASGTVDWSMWILLRDEGIFLTELARGGIMAAIPTHYLLGVLLFLGIRRARGSTTAQTREAQHDSPAHLTQPDASG